MNSDDFDPKLDALLAQALQEAREVARLAPKSTTVLDAQARSAGAASASRARREIDVLAGAAPEPEGGTPAGTAPWADGRWPSHRPPPSGTEVPRFSRIGEFRLAISASDSPRGDSVPAVVPLLGTGNLLLIPRSDGVESARHAIAALAVRLLATTAPSTVWLYPVDPMLAGDSFIDLAPFGEDVVRRPRSEGASAGWGRQIDRLLEELATHIEEVKTRLPRARKKTFEEYNADPSGTPIPYRVLLLADFPYGFDSRSTERLVQVARNGPRAGVHLIALVNPDQAMPHGVSTDAVAAHCLVAKQASASTYRVQHAGMERAELVLDRLPPGSEAAPAIWDAAEWASLRPGEPLPASDSWLHRLAMVVNFEAKRAGSFVVPLNEFRPVDESKQFAPWRERSMQEVRTPIGKSVERKPQEFVLTEGGLPHALVSGATGRGKTVLLNAIILGLCWRYSPEELELCLIDFKDGLGFQGFRDLPHARLVALRGERELGVQVLKDIEKKMRERGALFKRERGADGDTVNNLATYRKVTGKPLPRVLVIFDEFQALLRGTDPLAIEAAGLLATVVGLGREFGFHIVLSTQTPRQSGITPAIQSQLATRVTLFLEEMDSQIVLSPRNSAAATLHGQGEALYNNAGGQPEGNHRFQVAFAPKHELPRAVAELASLSKARWPDRPPPRVLDGNLPASPAGESRLSQAVSSPPFPAPTTVRAYLGVPVDLETEHVFLTLSRRGQAHLLVFGRNGLDDDRRDCDAMALVVGAMATAAVQAPGSIVRLAVQVDEDDPLSELPHELLRAPGDVAVGGEPELKAWIEEFSTEVDRRKAEPGGPRGFMYLGVLGLHLFGCLDGGTRPPPVQEKLRNILQNGPLVGVHVFAHADDGAGLSRRLGDLERREFGTRVATRGSVGRKLFEITRATPEDVPTGEAWIDRVEKPGASRRLRTYGREVFGWLRSLSPH